MIYLNKPSHQLLYRKGASNIALHILDNDKDDNKLVNVCIRSANGFNDIFVYIL
jgi:hypothetical protein